MSCQVSVLLDALNNPIIGESIDPQIEAKLTQDSSTHLAYSVLTGRHVVGDRPLKLTPLQAVRYAVQILRGPWSALGRRDIEAEIATDPWAALQYEKEVLQRPWIEALPIINSDPVCKKLHKKYFSEEK